MIDFHCHILPGLDDGARSFDESLEMASIAQSDGIKEIVCTPHIKKGYATPTLKAIAEAVQELQSLLQSKRIDIRLYSAAEVALERNLADLVDCGEIPTIGGAERFILLELPWERIPRYTSTVISELISSGVTPIIAHLERYYQVIVDPALAWEFVEAGALVQVNSGSITGMFGYDAQVTARILVSHGLVHVIGSDAHSSGRRSPKMSAARDLVKDMVGEEQADKMFRLNASEILAGRLPKKEAPRAYKDSKPGSWRRGLLGKLVFYLSRQLRGLR